MTKRDSTKNGTKSDSPENIQQDYCLLQQQESLKRPIETSSSIGSRFKKVC